MKITICGSMQHESRMAVVADELVKRGYQVDKPDVVEAHVYEGNLDANATLKRGFIDGHFAKINTSDAVLVVNEAKSGIENYIGGNTLIEIAYAYSQGLEVFLLNSIPDVDYTDEIRGMHPIILNGNIDILDDYVASLPLVYMSTESELKQRGVSRAMRRAGIPVRVDGKKVPSGVSEQPMTVDETYEGAMNRHGKIKELGVSADYYATVESGLHQIHENHSHFGCQVLILEKVGEEVRVGVDLDLEFPKAMLDKVPSEYADVGVLVQELYGAKSKDPFPYFTGGKITRRHILENAFYRLAAREV